MDFTVEPAPDAATFEAVRASAAAVGVRLRPAPAGLGAAWWRAGVADAVECAAERPEPARAPRYEAALSPRRTRGATRA